MVILHENVLILRDNLLDRIGVSVQHLYLVFDSFIFAVSFSCPKSVLQHTEATMPPQLALLNGQFAEVFGEKYKSLFMATKPSELLFDGIPLCINTTGIARIICSVIKSQQAQSIRQMDDGSMRFSFFAHVR